MSHQNELDKLEAVRARLQSMIDYHNPTVDYRNPSTSTTIPLWVVGLCAGMLSLLGWIFVSGVIAGEYSLLNVVALTIVLALMALIGMRKITVFGIPITVFELIFLVPGGQTAGEPQIRQRLADCETKIKKLKERRS